MQSSEMIGKSFGKLNACYLNLLQSFFLPYGHAKIPIGMIKSCVNYKMGFAKSSLQLYLHYIVFFRLKFLYQWC